MGLKWGPDPALDVFRDGLAALSLEGEVVAYLATIVERMWWRQERVWLLVTHLDGTHERIGEDYEPWTSVAYVREGPCLGLGGRRGRLPGHLAGRR